MKRFGSSRPTACPDNGGRRMHVSNPAGVYGPCPMARGRIGVRLDYGAARAAFERQTLYSLLDLRF